MTEVDFSKKGKELRVRLVFMHLTASSSSAMLSLLLSFRRYLPTAIERKYLVSISFPALPSYKRFSLPKVVGVGASKVKQTRTIFDHADEKTMDNRRTGSSNGGASYRSEAGGIA